MNFIDLTGDMAVLNNEFRDSLFIKEGPVNRYNTAAGHYSAEGNKFIEKALYERMLQLPEVADKLRY